MISGHALGDAISIVYLVRELYFEAIIVEAIGVFLLYFQEFLCSFGHKRLKAKHQIMGGDNACDGKDDIKSREKSTEN